jgi:hypothetical protein
MVLALELTEEEVLERLKKILKGVSVVPHTVPEYRANNLPPALSCLSSASIFSLYFLRCWYFLFLFPLLLLLLLVIYRI